MLDDISSYNIFLFIHTAMLTTDDSSAVDISSQDVKQFQA